jgi:hypothetical protein
MYVNEREIKREKVQMKPPEVVVEVPRDGDDHGLKTPNKAFFSLKCRTFGLGQINSGAFGLFSGKLSAPILVQ